jgi:hypothetical protein
MEKSIYAGAAARAEQDLGKRIQLQGKQAESFGPISQIRGVGKPKLGFNSPINFTHEAASGAAEIVKLGDGIGGVEDLGGYTVTAYDSGTPYSNSVLNNKLDLTPCVVGEVNYGVGAVAQFNEVIEYASANLGGTFSKRPLQNIILVSKRNTQQNSLLLTLDFAGQGVVLDSDNALFITVGASQTISQFTISPVAVSS